jgi:hypothetical protein
MKAAAARLKPSRIKLRLFSETLVSVALTSTVPDHALKVPPDRTSVKSPGMTGPGLLTLGRTIEVNSSG